jgi:hypothetical protein
LTPVLLLEELRKFIDENTRDIVLSVRPAKGGKKPGKRAAEVHKMRLPDKDTETKQVPYILLQFLTGSDDQEPGDQPDSECKIRIIIATYSEDGSEGATDVLNVITRIRIALLKAGEIGKQFLLRMPLEYIVYPDDTAPYYMGEMLTVWEMPIIQREVNIHYVDE